MEGACHHVKGVEQGALIITCVSTCGWWWGSSCCLLIVVVVGTHGVGCGDGLWMLHRVLASTLGRGWWVLATIRVALLHAHIRYWQGMHKY